MSAIKTVLAGAVPSWRDALGIRKQLRLYDARGTAVTRLVRAGCTLSELAYGLEPRARRSDAGAVRGAGPGYERRDPR